MDPGWSDPETLNPGIWVYGPRSHGGVIVPSGTLSLWHSPGPMDQESHMLALWDTTQSLWL